MNVLPELYPQRFWASIDASMVLETLKMNRDPLYSLIRAAETRDSYLAGGFVRELFMLNLFLHVEFVKQNAHTNSPLFRTHSHSALDMYLINAGNLDGEGLEPEEAKLWSSNTYYRDSSIEGLNNVSRYHKDEIEAWLTFNGPKIIKRAYKEKRIFLASDIDIFSYDRPSSARFKTFLEGVHYGDKNRTAFKLQMKRLRIPVFSDTLIWRQDGRERFSVLDYRNEDLSRPDVQIINDPQNRLGERVFGNPIATVDAFDISSIRLALHKGRFILDQNCFGDIVTGYVRLVNMGNNPLAEMARLNKYASKGFFVSNTEFAKVLLHAESLSDESRTKMYSKLLSGMAYIAGEEEARDSKGLPYIGKTEQEFDSRYLQSKAFNYPQNSPPGPQSDGDWEDMYAAFFGDQV